MQAMAAGTAVHESKGVARFLCCPTPKRSESIMFSRIRYYLSLVPVSLYSIKNRAAMLALLFGLPIVKPALLRFRDGTQFKVRTAMDAWVIIETYLGHTYEQNGFDIKEDWLVIDIGAVL